MWSLIGLMGLGAATGVVLAVWLLLARRLFLDPDDACGDEACRRNWPDDYD